MNTISNTAVFFGKEIISDNTNKEIVVGIHGTALSTILNFYDNNFGCEDFLRVIDAIHY